MATTYLEITNLVLRELNEVLLTSASFDAATNIQAFVKESVNRAYSDMHDDDYKWPWLRLGDSLGNFFGNTYIETVAGQRWYALKPTATTVDDEYSQVNWDEFTATTEGVTGEVAPYTYENLQLISLEDWRDRFSKLEQEADTKAVPKRVIRDVSSFKFGLSPIPDKVYRVYFYAWNQLTPLVNYNDTLVIPSQYNQVLVARVRYYVWQFKDQMNRSADALQDYKKGLQRMREALNPSASYMKTDFIRHA